MSPEDREVVQKMYSEQINHWRKRKRMFKDLWDAITENSPKDLKEFKVPLYDFSYLLRMSILYLGCLLIIIDVITGGTWNRI